MRVRCRLCGWEGEEGEIPAKTFHEDYGDVYLDYCPQCRIPDETNDLFEEVNDEH